MTINLRVLNSSGRLVTSMTQPNGKSTISLPLQTQKWMVSLVILVTPGYGISKY